MRARASALPASLPVLAAGCCWPRTARDAGAGRRDRGRARQAGGAAGGARACAAPARRRRASRRRGRCADVSPNNRPGWTRRWPRCSTARRSCSTTPTTPARSPAPRRRPARRRVRSRRTTTARISLVRLDRLDEARDALALALALAPDDPETLEAAADLNINQLPPSVDRSALGLEYARRGSRRVAAPRSRAGRAAGAARGAGADRSRARGRGAAPHRRARWRRRRASPRPSTNAASRCSSCAASRRRATRSRRCWRRRPDHAHALYHLGLIEERLGDDPRPRATWPRPAPPTPRRSRCRSTCRGRTSRRACSARSPSCPTTSAAIWAASRSRRPICPTNRRSDRREAAAVADDPGAVPRACRSTTPSAWSRRPPGRAGKGRAQPVPPWRATPADAPSPPRRRRAICSATPATAPSSSIAATCCAPCTTSAELDQAITRTLLHEVGHLRGEDDGSLRDRGLE